MTLYKNTLYHVYSQGNNKEVIFREKEDYELFLSKLEAFVLPNCKLLCYCLMPNHFHFLLLTTTRSVEEIRIGSLIQTQLTNGFRLLLSGYAHEFNKKYNRTGSLFRQKTKFRLVDNSDPNYPKRVFRYVLYKPKKDNLVKDLSDWEFSSFVDLLEGRTHKVFDYIECQEVFQFSLSDLEDINAGFDDISYFDD